MKDTLLIIPAYNEGKNIGKVLDGLLELKLPVDIVVVNDGSVDDTEQIVLSKNIKVISLPFNIGYGGALQTGYRYAFRAGYKRIIQMDADGQHEPECIFDIMDCMDSKNPDMVIGSRFLEGTMKDFGIVKRNVFRFLRLCIRLFSGKKVSDSTSGLKGLSRNIFGFYAYSDGFSADYPDADILIQAFWAGFSFEEIPVKALERNYGKSMHSGLGPVYYLMKFVLNTSVILLRHKLKGGNKL